jgi:hypothetical protein
MFGVASDRVNDASAPGLADANSVHDENGVDRTLVRACLRDTPLERLEALEDVYLLREAVSRGREPLPPTH